MCGAGFSSWGSNAIGGRPGWKGQIDATHSPQQVKGCTTDTEGLDQEIASQDAG